MIKMIHRAALQTTGMNDDAISTNDNTRIIFNHLSSSPLPLPPPDEDVSINNLRMSITYYHRHCQIKFVIPKVGVRNL